MSDVSSAGFFTLGVPHSRYKLPHRALPVPMILLIQKVLYRALIKLRSDGFNVGDATEDQLTTALRAVVENDFRRTGCIAGFNTRIYESVSRQAQVANFNGNQIGKTPDLCFRLQADEEEVYEGVSEYDALFVECKPVDNNHPSGSKYCDDGLIRFVRGDYAWAMQDAMMLAYSRSGRTVVKHLIPSMSRQNRKVSLATAQLPQPLVMQNKDDDNGGLVYASVHHRSFDWPHDKGKACDITVYHIWLDCS